MPRVSIFHDFYRDTLAARHYHHVTVDGALWLIPADQQVNPAALDAAIRAARDVPGHEVRL